MFINVYKTFESIYNADIEPPNEIRRADYNKIDRFDIYPILYEFYKFDNVEIKADYSYEHPLYTALKPLLN